jgi:hypothetical protein
LKVLVPVKIFQFQDLLNESERYQDAANGLYKVFVMIAPYGLECDMECH